MSYKTLSKILFCLACVGFLASIMLPQYVPGLPPVRLPTEQELIAEAVEGFVRALIFDLHRQDASSFTGLSKPSKDGRDNAWSSDQGDIGLTVESITLNGDKATANCSISNKKLKLDKFEVGLSSENGMWVITSAPELQAIAPEGTSWRITNTVERIEPPSPLTPTLRFSSRAIIGINHPWTATPVIHRNLTVQHIQRQLFGQSARLDLEAKYFSGDPNQVVSIMLDPVWDRIVFSQREGNWIRSYGDNPGEYQFMSPLGMAVTYDDDIYVADTENGRIVKLRYSNGAISLLMSFTIADVIHPVDVSVKNEPFNPTLRKIWVADNFAGSLTRLDINHNVDAVVQYYTVGTQTFRLARPKKVLASETSSTGVSYVAFIDQDRNAFVLANANQISGNTIAAVRSTEFDPSIHELSSIGQDLCEEYWVSDASRGWLHKFTAQGEYVATVSGFSSPQNVSKYPFFVSEGQIRASQYQYVAESWGDNTGLNAFFPGADALDLSISQNASGHGFSARVTLTNKCYVRLQIVDLEYGNVYVDFLGAVARPPGTIVASTLARYLPYGRLKLRVEYKPYYDEHYGAYSRGWRSEEIVFTNTMNITFTQNPMMLYYGGTAQISCDISPGIGSDGATYSWSPIFNPPRGMSASYTGNVATVSYGAGKLPIKYNVKESTKQPDAGLYCTVSVGSYSLSGGTNIIYTPEGGCPFVYTWNGEGFIEDNNILPQSEYEGNEGRDVTDYYQLFKRPLLSDGKYRLAIGEFEQERSRIDHVRLMLIDHRPEASITVDDSGRVIQFAKPLALIDAQLDSQSVIKKVSELDGMKVEVAKDETMQLWFDQGGGTLEQGLLLVGQVPSESPKKNVAGTIAAADRGKEAVFTSFRFRRNPSYTWVVIPARDTSSVQIDIQWKQDAAVDYTELSRKLEYPFTVQVVGLARSVHSASGDIMDRLRYRDEDYAELLPNEWIDLEFNAPPLQEGMERTFVFVTQGRYDRLQAKSALASAQPVRVKNTLPTQVMLGQNYPNPFNPLTIVNYQLPIDNFVTIKVYDLLGRELSTIVDGWREAGSHEAVVDASALSSGIYFYRLTTEGKTQTRKFVVMK